jgi:alpha-ketoglutaric semialdehyde dehydrogenase
MQDWKRNYVGGEWIPAGSGATFPDVNPARRQDLIGAFPASDAGDVDRAVAAARSSFPAWRRVPAPRRGEILFRIGELLRDRKEELARAMTREMGKILQEARGDVQEAIDTAFYAAGEGRRLFGQTTPSELPDKLAFSVRQPLGVCGLITPWNFPVAIPSWKLFPALMCGNTAVLKPSEETPWTATLFVEILEEAGIPPGVVNLVHGKGPEVGAALVEHPDVALISFTGSTATGRRIAEACGRGLKRLSLEMGGKNAQIVLEDADLDLALEGAVWGSFATAGQRCTATSRLLVHRDVLAEFTERLVARAAAVRLGDGLDENSEVGPVINERQRSRIHEYVEIGQGEGARLLIGGHVAASGPRADGWFYAPTVFGDARPEMRIAREEIFGPVTAIIPVADLDEAVRILNASRYGLSSSIYTQDINRAMHAVADIEAGITYINGPTIGAEVQLPFGGVKETGNGHREAGSVVYETYTEWKSVYIDYSGRLQKAQIDTDDST